MSPNAIDADLEVAELLTTAGLADPYARIERIRALGRAVPSPIGVILTGYDDCQNALRNHALVSDAQSSFQPLMGDEWKENRALKLLSESLLFLEGAQHNRVRKLVASAFTPAAVASWQPTIDQIVNDLLQQVSAQLKRGEEVDLVKALARPLPIAVMAELIGLPRSDAAHLRELIGTIADLSVGLVLGEEAMQKTHEIGVELEMYLRNALATSTNEGRSVMGRIALDPNEQITDDDRVSLAFILLAAGFETTAMLVANAIALLHENPSEWNQLVREPDRAASVAEETLRLQTPATFTGRIASAPTEVADTAVEPGTAVTMFLAAANRDPAKFTEPQRFNPDRYADGAATTAPLSFGSGMHHCIGSLLARSEAISVLRRLNTLGPVEELALVEPVTWRPSVALRGVASLVVKRVPIRPTDTHVPGPITHLSTDGKQRRKAATKLFRGVIAGLVGSKVRAAFARGERKAEIKEKSASDSAAKAVEVMGDLKGVTMKMGQLASFMGASMPDAAKRSLSALQSSAPAMPVGEAEAAVQRALGKHPSELFRSWEATPVAAASIGQVHRATLHDGRAVAVKVQYPGVDEAIAADLNDQARMTKLIARFAMRNLDAETLSRDLSARISEELDFTNEARHHTEFAERYKGHPFIRVPEVVPEFSTRTVLTTTWADGENWNTFLERATLAEKDRAGEIIARFVFGSTRRYRHFNADPNPGNFLFHPNAEYITFLDFGLAKRLTKDEDTQIWLLVDALMDRTSAHDIVRQCISGGYLNQDHGLDPELLKRYLMTTTDFYDSEPFTVTNEWLAKIMKTTFMFEGEYSVIRSKLNSRADFFLRDRVYWGMTGILAELNASAGWKSINNEYRQDAPPSTPLGEAEALWRSVAVVH
jgi:cytochrome P450/predicted unusual protein kinase regulating ubiquinone biosynthesis (AarF/ABC1/UbiB family)